MKTVTDRELCNSGEIFRWVEAGESIGVTNNGRVVALLVPPPIDAVTGLIECGQLRPALRDVSSLRSISRRTPHHTSEQIISDVRSS